MDEFSFALIWLGFFASVFFGWYFYLQARSKERMALIEKNIDLSEIFKVRKVQTRFPWLKLGMLLAGVGIGFCMNLFLPTSGDEREMTIFGSILFFGGLGLIIAHFIEKSKDQ